MSVGLVIACALYVLAAGVFACGVWNYVRQERQELRDAMGQSILFDYAYLAAAILLSIGLLVHPGIRWWWSAVSLTSIVYAPLLVKYVLSGVFGASR